jgi:LuxR family transcriptional regulator, maltose regulon positive regulatory protein
MASTSVDVGGGREAFDGSAPVLLATKLHRPRPRPEYLSRERLVRLLDVAVGRGVALLAAPAGWGKTTLLAEWMAAHPGQATAWLSLDAGDDDPARFVGHLVAALRTVAPDVGAASLGSLRAPGAGLVDVVLPLLVNDLAAVELDLVLVLDDFQLVTNPAIQEATGFLLERRPPALRVVVSARAEPGFGAARMRARGELSDIGVDQLRFSLAETLQLLTESYHLGLGDDQVARLHERTEGWAAGLYLAALSVRGRPDPNAFIASFAGDDRQLADYLTGEVLDHLEPRVRRFLLQTSILDRFTAALCDAVTGATDSARALEHLERADLFLVALDSARQWYRYHSLFAEVLRGRLAREMPEAVPELHRRASAWYRSTDAIREAAAHATAAGDVGDAVALVGRHWPRFLRAGQVETVDGWLRALPADAVTADWVLCLAAASVAIEQDRLDDAERWLAAADPVTSAEGAEPAPRTGPIASLRATLSLHRGDVGAALAQARTAVATDPGGHTPWWNAAHLVLGAALWLAGNTQDARAALERALTMVRHTPMATVWALGCLAAVELDAGDPARGLTLAEQALAQATAENLQEHPLGAPARLAAGRALAELRRHDAAQAETRRGLALARRGHYPNLLAYGLVTQAIIAHAGGSTGSARSLLADAQELLRRLPDPGIAAGWVEATQRRLRITAIRRSAASLPGVWDLSERELTVLRLLAAGLSQREVADQLYVSFNTVKTHSRSILRKLDAPDRAQAIARAHELGLL